MRQAFRLYNVANSLSAQFATGVHDWFCIIGIFATIERFELLL